MADYIHTLIKGSGENAPTLVLFHGTGGNENQFLDLGRALAPTATLLAPRGDVNEFGALRYFKRTGEGQYDMADLHLRTENMASFLKANLSGQRIWGLGYSNGANILANVMINHPDIFDAAVLMHPLLPFAPAAQVGLKDKRILITAGENDPICPAPMTRKLGNYFAEQGALLTTYWHSGGHEVAQTELQAIQQFMQIELGA